MTHLGITLPTHNTRLSACVDLAVNAEQAGFDSVWAYEIYKDPTVTLAATAQATFRIQLATAPLVSFSRSPAVSAILAADLAELSNGRLLFGIGAGSPEQLASLHGVSYERAVDRLRDYVLGIRAAWRYFETGEHTVHAGEFYTLELPGGNPWLALRPQLRHPPPICLAAVRPRMLALAGEIADGAIGYMYTVNYAREVARPAIEHGAERAGRDPGSVHLANETVCSVSTDRAEAMRRARIQVAQYVAHPATEHIADHHGLGGSVAAARDAIMRHGPAAAESAVGDDLVELFTISGTPDECRAKLTSYADVLTHVVLHTPYAPPLTADDSADAFDAILQTFGSWDTSEAVAQGSAG